MSTKIKAQKSKEQVEYENSREPDQVLDNHRKKMLGAYIAFSLDIENNFKLYSYNILTHDAFRNRIDELIEGINQIRE